MPFVSQYKRSCRSIILDTRRLVQSSIPYSDRVNSFCQAHTAYCPFCSLPFIVKQKPERYSFECSKCQYRSVLDSYYNYYERRNRIDYRIMYRNATASISDVSYGEWVIMRRGASMVLPTALTPLSRILNIINLMADGKW